MFSSSNFIDSVNALFVPLRTVPIKAQNGHKVNKGEGRKKGAISFSAFPPKNTVLASSIPQRISVNQSVNRCKTPHSRAAQGTAYQW
jgi:hypothetical protein